MVGLLGKKMGMTQIFDDQGFIIPVTLIKAGPCVVVQRKTNENDGYEALQLGFEDGQKKSVKKAREGHFARAGIKPRRILKEFRVSSSNPGKVGDEFSVSLFNEGDYVDITGVSKGKGFSGVIKRWGFHGSPKSHGSEKCHRRPGSLSASSFPSRVFKGKRLPGRMGGVKKTVQNIEVMAVKQEQSLLIVKGAVPGARGGCLIIKKAVKKRSGDE